MSTTAEIETALRQALPQDQQYAAVELARLVEAVKEGRLTQEQAQARLGAEPSLGDALHALAGKQIEVSSSVIAFGAGAQMGDVTISGDVAGGNIVKLILTVEQKTINIEGGDYAEGDIDKREGAFVSGGTVQGPVVGNNQGTINAYYTYSAPTRSPQEQRNRRAMLTRVKNIWIDGLLNRSLTDELRIELNLTDRPDLLNLPLNAVVQELERPPQALPTGVPISQVFDQVGGEFLILGAPGAGKTTLLLELLRDLLKRAEQDEAHPIPVVFPLSTWATEGKPLKDWLVDQLNVIYDVPKMIGLGWMDENEVLPLLDGLDEVAAEHRDACVEAINKYRQEIGGLAPAAVASRIADYEALKGRLRLRGAVLVEPLTRQQVESYLGRVGEPLRAVRELVAGDPEVMELLDSPLMLSVVSLAFQDASPETLRAEGTVEERRTRLWEMYIERMFERKGKVARYTRRRTTHWLSWVARQMVHRQQTTFFVEQLQHDWLPSRTARIRYVVLDRCGSTIGFIMTLGLSFGLLSVLYNQLDTKITADYITIGLLYGIGIAFFGGKSDLNTLQSRTFLQLTRDTVVGFTIFLLITIVSRLVPFFLWSSELKGAFLSGIINGFVGGLVGVLMGRPGLSARLVIPIEHIAWSWAKALRGGMIGTSIGLFGGCIIGFTIVLTGTGATQVLFLGLRVGLIYGLGLGVVYLIIGGLSGKAITTAIRSNQGIWRSGQSALIYGLSIGLVAGLGLKLINSLLNQSEVIRFSPLFSLIIGLILILIGVLSFGGYAVQSHYILRYLLYRQGSLPFRDLIPWLDHCCDRLFLRRVGGGYIFIHRMLLEHFARKYEEQTKEAQ